MNKYRLVQYLFYVTISCLVLGTIVLLNRGGAVSSYLFMDLGLPEHVALLGEKSVASALFLLALWLMIKPHLLPALLLSLLFALLSVAVYLSGGKHFAEWAIPAQLARIAMPMLFYTYLKHHKNYILGSVKLVIATVFITHGLEAIKLNPVFLDYLLLNTPFELSTFHAISTLTFIGYLDIIGAVFALINVKWAIHWLFIWGFLTSLLRVMDAGWENYPEFLVRTPHFVLPLILIVMFKQNNVLQFGFPFIKKKGLLLNKIKSST